MATEPFFPSGAEAPALLGGAAILCLSFLGFDAVFTLSEETRDPRRRIPRAIMLVTSVGGAVFIVVSYIKHLVFPQWQEFTDVNSAALDIVGCAGGSTLAAFFTAAYIAGCFASAMASQTSVSRILFAMRRDGALPRPFFGRLHPHFRTPVLVGLLSFVALVISLELASVLERFADGRTVGGAAQGGRAGLTRDSRRDDAVRATVKRAVVRPLRG